MRTTNQAILLSGAAGTSVVNNTVYQPTGDAIDLEGSNSQTVLSNNILWTQAGYDINVAPQSEVGFQSDYNDLYTTGTGALGLWEGQAFTITGELGPGVGPGSAQRRAQSLSS